MIAYVWDSATGLKELPLPQGFTDTEASTITPGGVVAGTASAIDDQGHRQKQSAFLWDTVTGYVLYAPPLGRPDCTCSDFDPSNQTMAGFTGTASQSNQFLPAYWISPGSGFGLDSLVKRGIVVDSRYFRAGTMYRMKDGKLVGNAYRAGVKNSLRAALLQPTQ